MSDYGDFCREGRRRRSEARRLWEQCLICNRKYPPEQEDPKYRGICPDCRPEEV